MDVVVDTDAIYDESRKWVERKNASRDAVIFCLFIPRFAKAKTLLSRMRYVLK